VKANSLLSKARRNLILRLIPGDIVDDCKVAIYETQTRGDTADPESARKKLFDAFAGIGVGPTKIKAYLGHDNRPTPAEMVELRAVYTAISTGESTWAAVWEQKHPDERKSPLADMPDAGVPNINPETGEVG
jgi:hypothetical protein